MYNVVRYTYWPGGSPHIYIPLPHFTHQNVGVAVRHWDASELLPSTLHSTPSPETVPRSSSSPLVEELLLAMKERRWLVVLNAHLVPDAVRRRKHASMRGGEMSVASTSHASSRT